MTASNKIHDEPANHELLFTWNQFSISNFPSIRRSITQIICWQCKPVLRTFTSGSAIFYKIPTFPAGHVAIATGEKDADGEYLVITSGGYRRKDMRKEKISEEVRAVNAQILGWAKIL
jgi:hypothetical protein